MRRGEVFRFELPKGIGHEQQGECFGVVVQADSMLPTRVPVGHLGAVDAQRRGRRVGPLAADDMWAVDEALATVLGLD